MWLCARRILLDIRIVISVFATLLAIPIAVPASYSFAFRPTKRTQFKPVWIFSTKMMPPVGVLIPMNIFLYILLPLSKSAIFSTSLLSIVLIWNESFWSLNLTAFEAAPLTTFISSYSGPEDLFWAKLSASSTLAILPIMFLGGVT